MNHGNLSVVPNAGKTSKNVTPGPISGLVLMFVILIFLVGTLTGGGLCLYSAVVGGLANNYHGDGTYHYDAVLHRLVQDMPNNYR